MPPTFVPDPIDVVKLGAVVFVVLLVIVLAAS